MNEGGGEGRGKKGEKERKNDAERHQREASCREMVGRVWLDSRQKVKGLVYRTPAGQKLVYVVSFS